MKIAQYTFGVSPPNASSQGFNWFSGGLYPPLNPINLVFLPPGTPAESVEKETGIG
jgi:hypothetical protein